MNVGYNGQNVTALVTSPRPNNADGGRVAVPIYKSIPSLTLQQTEAFWARVRVDMYDSDACWPWTGKVDRSGYGRLRLPGAGLFGAHRVAFTLARGPIPDGLTLDHSCRNILCCNPEHLEPMTSVENSMRGDSPPSANARKTHCEHGHEFTPDNTYQQQRDGTVQRICRTCVLSRTAKWKRERGFCVQCSSPSATYRCARCRVIHNRRRP